MSEAENDKSNINNHIYVETPRMILRNFVPEDVSDLHEILGDDDTMK